MKDDSASVSSTGSRRWLERLQNHPPHQEKAAAALQKKKKKKVSSNGSTNSNDVVSTSTTPATPETLASVPSTPSRGRTTTSTARVRGKSPGRLSPVPALSRLRNPFRKGNNASLSSTKSSRSTATSKHTKSSTVGSTKTKLTRATTRPTSATAAAAAATPLESKRESSKDTPSTTTAALLAIKATPSTPRRRPSAKKDPAASKTPDKPLINEAIPRSPSNGTKKKKKSSSAHHHHENDDDGGDDEQSRSKTLLTPQTKFKRKKKQRRSAVEAARKKTVATLQRAMQQEKPMKPSPDLLKKMKDPRASTRIDDMIAYKQFLLAKQKELSRQKTLCKIRLKALAHIEIPKEVDDDNKEDGEAVATPKRGGGGEEKKDSVDLQPVSSQDTSAGGANATPYVPYNTDGYSVDGMDSTTHHTVDDGTTVNASSIATLSLQDKDRLIEEQRQEILYLRSQLPKQSEPPSLLQQTPNNKDEDDMDITMDDDSMGIPTNIMSTADHQTVASVITSNTAISSASTTGNLGFIPPCYWVEEMPWRLEAPLEHMTGVYTGNVSRDYNIPYGRGKLIFSNGDVYDGPMRHGELHGPGGVYVWSNGARYQGRFWHNLQHGKGQYRSSKSAAAAGEEEYYEYVGNYEYGQRHGTGIQYNAGGSIFHNGRWKYGKPTALHDFDYAVAADDESVAQLSQYESETDRSIYDSGDDYEELAAVGFTPTLVREASIRSFKLTTPTIPEVENDSD